MNTPQDDSAARAFAKELAVTDPFLLKAIARDFGPDAMAMLQMVAVLRDKLVQRAREEGKLH